MRHHRGFYVHIHSAGISIKKPLLPTCGGGAR
jgi:hypothetical protein